MVQQQNALAIMYIIYLFSLFTFGLASYTEDMQTMVVFGFITLLIQNWLFRMEEE
jgi:hypothetical protein